MSEKQNYPGQTCQAETDHEVIELWLAGRPEATQRAYAYEVTRLLEGINKTLVSVTLEDLQGYFAGLSNLAPASQARAINAAKSLFSFGLKIGYLKWDYCAPIISPKIKNCLAEPVLSESQAHAMIALETDPRNRVFIRLIYGAGIGVSDMCGLKWKDTQARDESGQVTISGKGGKTRMVLLSADTWRELVGLRGEAGPEAPVFPSRKGHGHLSGAQAWRIVKTASARVGPHDRVSPNQLRRMHTCHSLDKEHHIQIYQDPLGLVIKERRMEILEAENKRLHDERMQVLDKNRSRFMTVDGD